MSVDRYLLSVLRAFTELLSFQNVGWRFADCSQWLLLEAHWEHFCWRVGYAPGPEFRGLKIRINECDELTRAHLNGEQQVTVAVSQIIERLRPGSHR